MINGNIEQFLDTGWYSEATLYYQDFSYPEIETESFRLFFYAIQSNKLSSSVFRYD